MQFTYAYRTLYKFNTTIELPKADLKYGPTMTRAVRSIELLTLVLLALHATLFHKTIRNSIVYHS